DARPLRMGSHPRCAATGCAAAGSTAQAVVGQPGAVALAGPRRERGGRRAAAGSGAAATDPAPLPTTAAVAYMASTIKQDNGTTGWTATMDLQHARMVVVPAAPATLAQGRAPELWLIPAGQKPIAVGMISRDQPTTLALAPALLAQLGPTAALAVSVEPPGGSPTGQPTGPVIAKGAIGAAPETGGDKVAGNARKSTERPRV